MRMVLMALFMALATPALAQRCAPSTVVIQTLGEKYGEVVVDTVVRVADDGLPVEWIMWVNPETGSWSLTGTRGGITCLFKAGRSGYAGQMVADFLDGPAA